MKKIFMVVFGVLFFLSAARIYALQVAYVDIEKVFNEYEGTKKAKAKLQDKLDKEKTSLEAKKKEIQSLQDSLEKQKTVLSKEKEHNMEEQLQTKLEKLQADAADTQQKLLDEEKTMTANIVEEIRAIVQKVAKEKGYDYVFERNNLLYGGDDLTAFVIKKMNEE